MAEVRLTIGGREYAVACRDGGEDHLRAIAAEVDKKAADARAAVGDATESRQLLFAALLLADALVEARAGVVAAPALAPAAAPDPGVARALEGLAERIEKVADALEGSSANA